MKTERHIFSALAMLMFIAFGCASGNVDPFAAHAHTGYIDFYSTTDAELCWEVRDGGHSGNDFRTVFSDVKPVQGDVLRLRFSPGHHRLHVTFLNRVILKPAEVDVVVETEKVTPLRVILTETGATTVLSKQTTMGGTPSGRGGRRTKINSEETVMFTISAIPDAAVPYQPKGQMPYTNQPK